MVDDIQASDFVQRFLQGGERRFVGDPDDLGSFAPTFPLNDRRNAHLVCPEHRCNLRQHAWSVYDFHPQAETAFYFADGLQAGVRAAGANDAGFRAEDDIAGGVQDVADDAVARRRPTCPLTVKHQPPDIFPLHQDGIELVADGCQRMGFRHHRRVNPHLNRLAILPCNCQQLDSVTQLVRVADVRRFYRSDAFSVNRLHANAIAEGNGGEDGDFVGGVVSVHIVGRVGFGEAFLLGFPQRLLKTHPVSAHAGEDVVGRAIDNADDAVNRLASEALLEGGDDGDATCDAGFKVNIRAPLFGSIQQFAPAFCQQFLVGGHDGFAITDGGHQQLVGGL
jgi:hypothetical protein